MPPLQNYESLPIDGRIKTEGLRWMQTNPKDITEMRSIHPHPHSWRFLFRYHIVFGKMSTKTQNRIIWQRSLNRERWNVDSEIEWFSFSVNVIFLCVYTCFMFKMMSLQREFLTDWWFWCKNISFFFFIAHFSCMHTPSLSRKNPGLLN